jgi:hypothetical protein
LKTKPFFLAAMIRRLAGFALFLVTAVCPAPDRYLTRFMAAD